MFGWKITLAASFVLLCALGGARASETPTIDPAIAAQLRRLEPLTPDKVDIFVDSGQLTATQADYVKRNIGPNGQLALPDAAIVEQPKPAAPPPAASGPSVQIGPAPKPQVAVSTDPYAQLGYKLGAADQQRLTGLIAEYRFGDRVAIGRQLKAARPEVNQLIARAYTDPVDLPLKVALWEDVAGPADPDAALGLFDTYRTLVDVARPVLIPYDKDAGGVQVRRSARHTDSNATPLARFYPSRELRDMVVHVEELIARCPSPSAAVFLMNVYAQRYGSGEAPLRDDGRDRKRLVQACGGNPKKFDEDEAKTWGSTLTGSQRALIAEQLIPWLSHSNSDRRKIARDGLTICLPHKHPAWDAPRAKWDHWWEANKTVLTNEK